MKKFPLLLILLGLFAWQNLLADVVTPGEISRNFSIINLKDFPDLEFYYLNPTYYYNQGYQQGDPVEVVIEAGEDYSVGRWGDQAVLRARKKSDSEEVGESKMLVGGGENVSNERISYILDEIKIESVKDGLIHFTVQKSFQVFEDGHQKKIKKGSVGAVEPLYLGLAGAMALGLAIFFFLRRRKAAKA
ncbi:MAG: LPXTG cell wall anchor domain-containing protein [Bacteroidia bacterium]|nr:LPXTG cell wall anchor domain-containing protein [Bacteroidia bacterium]